MVYSAREPRTVRIFSVETLAERVEAEVQIASTAPLDSFRLDPSNGLWGRCGSGRRTRGDIRDPHPVPVLAALAQARERGVVVREVATALAVAVQRAVSKVRRRPRLLFHNVDELRLGDAARSLALVGSYKVYNDAAAVHDQQIDLRRIRSGRCAPRVPIA